MDIRSRGKVRDPQGQIKNFGQEAEVTGSRDRLLFVVTVSPGSMVWITSQDGEMVAFEERTRGMGA